MRSKPKPSSRSSMPESSNAGRGSWPRAVQLGLRSHLGIRLYVEDETLGALNMYSTSTDTIDPDVQHLAELFATHASLALGRAAREENLYTALGTRKLIGPAYPHHHGTLRTRQKTGRFEYLARVSQHSNIKVRDIAAELVTQRNDRSTRAK